MMFILLGLLNFIKHNGLHHSCIYCYQEKGSVLFRAGWYCTVYKSHIFLTHFSADGQLGFAVMN